VSRPKRLRVVRWWELSVERNLRIVEKESPVVSVVPPEQLWLVDLRDPSGHLVAVLAANGGHAPLVYEGIEQGAPTLVLLPDGLAAARRYPNQDGRPKVEPVGTPQPDWPVWCRTCRQDFPLPADRLHSARGAKPGRPGRMTVGISR
jgi:hypothetical protein